MTNESTTNRPACPFCKRVPSELAKLENYTNTYSASCCGRVFFVVLGADAESSWAKHCTWYRESTPKPVSDDNQPKIVMIPVRPRYDDDGKPSCSQCVFLQLGYVMELDCLLYDAVRINPREPYAPGPTCPVHNPEAREGMEAL